MKRLAPLARALAAFALLTLGAGAARAQSCAASFSSLSFGSNIDILAGVAIDSAGGFYISCSGFGAGAPRRVVVCVGFGAGNNSTSAPRYLASDANRLAYDIYSDAARTTRWNATPSLEPAFVLTAASPSVTAPYYGRIVAGQRARPVGHYVDTIAPDIRIRVLNDLEPQPSCASVNTPLQAAPFRVSATITPNCALSATNMVFPAKDAFVSNTDAQGAVYVICTTNAPYWIALDGGTSKAASPVARRMTLGNSSILYGLYQDAARARPWGSSQYIDTVAGTGGATVAAFPVYGRIPPQASPPPGTYTDLVTVTVNF